MTQPLYWQRPGSSTSYFRLHVTERPAFVPHLRRALEHALKAKETLSQNALYFHDLNDIGRQYLAGLFNAHIVKIQEVEAALDKITFEREAGLLESIMSLIEALLSHDDYYWPSPLIRKAQKSPGAPSDVDARARDILTLWACVILDYACRGYCEAVQGYYRPRVTAYISALRQALKMDQSMQR